MKISKTTIIGLLTAVLAVLSGVKPELFSEATNAILLNIVDIGWGLGTAILALIAVFKTKDSDPVLASNFSK